MSQKEKKPEVMSIMLFIQHAIAIFSLIFGVPGIIIGIGQQYTNKLIHAIIFTGTAVIAILSIRNIKNKKKNGYILSIISFCILIFYTFIFKFSNDLINLELKSSEMIHEFFKDPFTVVFHFVFLVAVLLIFILSPRVKSYFNMEHANFEGKKEFKFIYIFVIYCGLMFLNITFQVFYFQPASFKNNKELVSKSEKYFGYWLTVKSFENYEHNDNKFRIRFEEGGYVIYAVPDEERDFTVNWDGYIVDIIDNQIIIGEKLFNNSYEADFVLNIEEFDPISKTMVISGKKDHLIANKYEFKKE